MRFLAVLAAAYLFASAAYMLGRRVLGYGTPFGDSLTPAQRTIMRRSAKRRRLLFYSAFAVGLAVGYCVAFRCWE